MLGVCPVGTRTPSRCCCCAAAAAAAAGRQPQQARHELQGRQQQALHRRPASQLAQLRAQAGLQRGCHAAWLAGLRLRDRQPRRMVRQRNGVGVPRRRRNHVGCSMDHARRGCGQGWESWTCTGTTTAICAPNRCNADAHCAPVANVSPAPLVSSTVSICGAGRRRQREGC